MADDDLHAYCTDDPAALAAYRTAVAARAEFSARLRADCAALGGNRGALSSHRGFGGPEQITGLQPDGSGTIPAGWRIVRDSLEPARRGSGSAEARRWLDERQPGADLDPRYALKRHGLAYQSRTYSGRGGTFYTHLPSLFEQDGRLWACYKGKPDGDFPGEPSGLTWQPVALSAYYAAKEAADAERLRLVPVKCRACGCTDDQPCPDGCRREPDGNKGHLCTACQADILVPAGG